MRESINGEPKKPDASLSISYGSSKAESYSLQNDNTAKGSTMSAGGNINLVATGIRHDFRTPDS